MRIAFPIVVTIIVGFVAPQSVALVGFLMFGNLIGSAAFCRPLSETAQDNLANLITLLLGITISFSMRAADFVQVQTLMIMAIGLFAFVMDTIGGVLLAKFLNLFRKKKINPMVGGAGISAFPMSSRVVQKMAHERGSNQYHPDARGGRQCIRPDRFRNCRGHGHQSGQPVLIRRGYGKQISEFRACL